MNPEYILKSNNYNRIKKDGWTGSLGTKKPAGSQLQKPGARKD
jgi:hypothetical protein